MNSLLVPLPVGIYCFTEVVFYLSDRMHLVDAGKSHGGITWLTKLSSVCL